MQRESYDKNARHSTAITAYKLSDPSDHHTCGEDGREAVADVALDWTLDPRPGQTRVSRKPCLRTPTAMWR